MIRYFKQGAVVEPKQLVIEKELMELTVKELQAIASTKGIELPNRATKTEIVKALSESDK